MQRNEEDSTTPMDIDAVEQEPLPPIELRPITHYRLIPFWFLHFPAERAEQDDHMEIDSPEPEPMDVDRDFNQEIQFRR